MGKSENKKKILVIDDERDVAEQLSINLEASGYEVETLNKPLKAAETVQAFKPDAVLLDYRMPKASGAEVLNNIRRLRGFATTPIIFVSAVVAAGDSAKDPTEAHGGPMQKPVEIKDLVKRIEAELKAIEE